MGNERKGQATQHVHVGQEEDLGRTRFKIANATEQRKEIVFGSLRFSSHPINFLEQLIEHIVKGRINQKTPTRMITNPLQAHLGLVLCVDSLDGEKGSKADHARRRDGISAGRAFSGNENAFEETLPAVQMITAAYHCRVLASLEANNTFILVHHALNERVFKRGLVR